MGEKSVLILARLCRQVHVNREINSRLVVHGIRTVPRETSTPACNKPEVDVFGLECNESQQN